MAVPARQIYTFVGTLLFSIFLVTLIPALFFFDSTTTRHYTFNIEPYNVTRLCHTKTIISVNGQFPGPPIIAREGDRIVVQVVNHVPNNVTLHWHGVKLFRNGWADGPEYITQCPIQTGQNYTYNFTVPGQRGTLFWHAHISWQRSTVYGPIIILPSKNHRYSYPFPKPYDQVPIVFGEWWNTDTEEMIHQALHTGGDYNISDAYTINGYPGPLYNCSQDTFKLTVKPGKTYLLRIINAAMNGELFFSIANHSMTVVEADAVYVKPFDTDVLYIAPGQTTNVLLKTKSYYPNATFLMAARTYSTAISGFDDTTTAGILQYEDPPNNYQGENFLKYKELATTFYDNVSRAFKRLTANPFKDFGTESRIPFDKYLDLSTQMKIPLSPQLPVFMPSLPDINATGFVDQFTRKFRSLANPRYTPDTVPQRVQRNFFFALTLGIKPCPKGETCLGPWGRKFAATINNVSFEIPPIALLDAYYKKQFRKTIFTADFHSDPPFKYDYIGTFIPNNSFVSTGTRVIVLPYNTSVELVLQGTGVFGAESHPFHLHGYNFFVVGQGFGNYDMDKDQPNFNLVDPPERNTVSVPSGGWVVIRFQADNPGVWFMHCHYEIHSSWGMSMAWLVLDGKQPDQKIQPPPSDFPKC